MEDALVTRTEVRLKVGPDGILTLRVPVGLADASRDVVVTVKSVDAAEASDAEDWKRFVDETAGRWEGEPLVRPEQPPFEQRVSRS